MPLKEYCLSNRSLAELALVVCQSSERSLQDGTMPTTVALRKFWQSNRSLQRRWTSSLDEGDLSNPLEVQFLKSLSSRVFVTEMLIRTFGTLLTCLDLRSGTEDVTAIARNVASGMMQIRNRVLSETLLIPRAGHEHVLAIDQMRRRCDRWTDLLIGQIAGEHDDFPFAYDPERAKDFAGDSSSAGGSQSCAVGYLVSAGLRLEFIKHLPADPIDEPEFATMMQSILSCLPPTVSSVDHAMNSLLRIRILASEHRWGFQGL